jgi:hypothetical protein
MSTTNPNFADIQALLSALVGNDPNIGDAPHLAFWQGAGLTRDTFVQIQTDDWGAPGLLVALGNPNKSNLYLALAGIIPFDGSQLNRMPDIQADANGRYAQPDELQMVATWITNNAPA